VRALDLLIILAYLAGVVAAGAWFSRRQRTTSQYFLGGRKVPWWAVSASIVATETSTVTFISVPGIIFAAGGDFAFLQLVFGYLLGRVAISALLIPAYFRGELLTVYQLLRERFGPGVRALAASLFVVMRTVADGVRLLLTAFVLAAVWSIFAGTEAVGPVVAGSVVALGAIMILFTFLGGMEAVIWIEVAQLAIYLAGAVAAGIVLLGKIPGGWDAALALGREHGKLQLFHFDLDWARPYTFWAGLIGGCFLTMSTHGTDQYLVQRYLCTDSARKARLALLSSGAVVLIQFTGFLTIGLLLFAFYRPDLGGAPTLAGDRVFPHFITQHLPTGISGLVVAAIFAAAMSSSLNSIAATAVADLYRPVAPNRSDAHYLRLSHWLTVAAGLAQIVVALAVRGTSRSALDAVLSIASLLNGPVLGVFLLGALSRRAGGAAALIGMTAGLLVVVAFRTLTPLAWPWYAAVGALTTVVFGSIAGARNPRPEARTS
jgi:SSS family solute:Na+ symporter